MTTPYQVDSSVIYITEIGEGKVLISNVVIDAKAQSMKEIKFLQFGNLRINIDTDIRHLIKAPESRLVSKIEVTQFGILLTTAKLYSIGQGKEIMIVKHG